MKKMAENFFGITDIGKERKNNEDAFIAQKTSNGRFILAGAIDGVGGYSGGEVAASIAKDTIIEHLNTASSNLPELLNGALRLANERIYKQRLEVKEHESMACVLTIVVADIEQNEFFYIHVGDTRLYLFRDNSLVKITKDQSFVGFLEDSGRLSEEDAMQHPKRNEINKALGFSHALEPDYFETGQSPFLPGDVLLLCSDGLTDMVKQEAIIDILKTEDDLERKTELLVKSANSKGGRDNITAVLIKNVNQVKAQEATMPVATEKKIQDAEAVVSIQESVETIVPAHAIRRKNGPAVFLLSLLSVALIACCVYLLWELGKREKVAEVTVATPSINALSPLQQRLEKILAGNTSDTLILADSDFPEPILISRTVNLTTDSLFILARGKVVLQRDSSFQGPALSIPQEVNALTLSGLTFQDFEVAISSDSRNIAFQGLQFLNCTYPLQYRLPRQVGEFLNGNVPALLTLPDTIAATTGN